MNTLCTDTLLFLRLAGTPCGVRRRYIPYALMQVTKNLGGQLRFDADRIYVTDSDVLSRRLREIWGRVDDR